MYIQIRIDIDTQIHEHVPVHTPLCRFARLYFHQPSFALLDEATSAVNPEDEHALYGGLVDVQTTIFSIAHRMELRKYVRTYIT